MLSGFLFYFLLNTVYAETEITDNFQSISARINSAHTTWKADDNFSESNISSWRRLLGTKLSKSKWRIKQTRNLNLTRAAIPREFDARVKWPNCPTIRQISDQSQCGSCWAVAAADAFSDRYCIAKNGGFTTPLSALHLLSCCKTCGFGCNGGYPTEAWKFFQTNGVVTGGPHNSNVGCQPYPNPLRNTPECKEECTNSGYGKPFNQDLHKTKSTYGVRSVNQIQTEIMTNGPVEAAFLVYEDFFSYKSGVYKHETGKQSGAHAVRMIGWGTENGTPYWLLANSWTTRWGDNGFFKMLRGNDECRIESYIVAGLPKV